jgi:hypothetical protein
MIRMFRAGFFRHFLSGFALGAVGLLGFQAARADERPMYPPVAQTDTRTVT